MCWMKSEFVQSTCLFIQTDQPAVDCGGYDLQCLHRGEDRAGNILYESRGLVTLILTPPKHLFQGMNLAWDISSTGYGGG